MTRSIPAAVQNREIAKGRSMLMFSTTTSCGSDAASWLNRRSCRSQTEVSSDGVTLITLTFPAKSFRLTRLSSVQYGEFRRFVADVDVRTEQGQGISFHRYDVFPFIHTLASLPTFSLLNKIEHVLYIVKIWSS